jgi:hypothetical protein
MRIWSDENLIQVEVTVADLAAGGPAVLDLAAWRAWLDRLASALGARAHCGMSDQQWRASMTMDRPL